MAKGRKAKAGARYPCGKRRPEDPRKVGLEARQRVFGISEAEAKHTEAGYTLGRLFKRGLLRDPRILDQSKAKARAQQWLEAGNELGETIRTFMLSAGLGSPTAVALDPNRVRGRGGDKPIIGQARACLYHDALKELDRINYGLVKCKMPSAWEVCWQVCICERDEQLFPLTPAELGVLRQGLDRIYEKMPQVSKAA